MAFTYLKNNEGSRDSNSKRASNRHMDFVLSWHSSFFMAFVVLLCLGSGFRHVVGSVHGGNETDRLALLAFKAEITNDPFGALKLWNESINFCQWVGVTCGHQHQRVTVLHLDHQLLTGFISPHLGNLSFLRALMLCNNSLSHKIPPELGRLRRLEIMALHNNSLTGEIPPNISGCSDLVVLELSGNRLAGKIPAEIGHLSRLKYMHIAKNNLTGGLPFTSGNLSSLTSLIVADNFIGGNIPDAIGRLTNLKVLALGINRLVGTTPSLIFNLSSIEFIDVVMNQIQGILPSDLGITLPNLQFLGIGWNSFVGSIPISLSNATKLHYLGLLNNNFTGKVPPLDKLRNLWRLNFRGNHLGTGGAYDLSFLCSLSNATNLYGLDLGQNNFGGVLPDSMSNLSTNLFGLSLSGNKIGGSIPTGIGNLLNLQVLDLTYNHLTGNIPADIGKLQKLQLLNLWSNKFYGEIPLSLANLTFLTQIGLSENNLNGSIPSSLGKCQFLVTISLHNNDLSGTIPKEVVSLSSLLELYLSDNNLSGLLPMEVGILKNLEVLDVSENILSGQIPSTLGTCVVLRLLYMEDNKFWGVLPSTLANLRGIEEFDLSHNNFSGKLPDYLDGFVFLKKLNLSFNDFEGAVPERGLFKNASAISVVGNNKLCGGIAELQLHSCNSKIRRKEFSLTTKLIISISFGLLGLLLMLCFLYLCWFRKITEIPAFKVLGNSFLQLSYRSLRKATDDFSPANLIGVGSFGSVYKGILDQGGKVVAVKVLNLQFHGACKSFIAECKALKSIKHRNLVKVLTACSSVDYQGNNFKALVYEFMANGSLEEWLHPNENEDDAHEESRSLDLLRRLNIAIDVASALDYLHHHCSEPIVHCDLKPSNVLLDDEMIAHVGDFGLARFIVQPTCNSSANQSSSIGIRGSVGYAAPEYGMGHEISSSGDVYSYGILLLEIFTGKRPTHDMFTDSLSLHNWAKMALLEQVANIADPTLFQQRETGEASSTNNNTLNQSSGSPHKVQECLTAILKVGIACSEELPRDRLDINEVVTQLHAIKNTLLGSGVCGGRRARIAV